jgi:fluoride exporter
MSIEPTPTVETAEGRARPRAEARPRAGVLVAIGTGGTLGALVRYAILRGWPVASGEFPWSTLVINVSGSLLLGVVVTLVVERWPPTRYVRPFVGIGVCGGYTTWSTFMTEAALLVDDHRPGLAVSYVALSLGAGLAATYAGIALAGCGPSRQEGDPHEAGRNG